MALKSIFIWKTSQSNILPDPDDPNPHCKACGRTYKCKYHYKDHRLYIHGVKSVKFANQRYILGSMNDTCCKSCDSRFVNKHSYHGHLTFIHKVGWRQLQESPKDVIPDVNDPNFYCCSYQKTLANKNFFKAHLMQVHSIYYQPTLKKRSLHLDINEPSSSCRPCQKTYSSRGRYRTHPCALPKSLGRHEQHIENTVSLFILWN